MDIVARLRFDAARCELQFSKGVAGNIEEAADEIERLQTALRKILDSHHDEAHIIAERALFPAEWERMP